MVEVVTAGEATVSVTYAVSTIGTVTALLKTDVVVRVRLSVGRTVSTSDTVAN